MLIERTNTHALVENPLPDGSRIIVDSENETVFALNATAGAAWDACTVPTTLSGVADGMQRSLDHAATEELAEEAIFQLKRHNLVKTSETSPNSTRREFLSTLSTLAIPLVVSLSITEQRAHARVAVSVPSHVPLPSSPKK